MGCGEAIPCGSGDELSPRRSTGIRPSRSLHLDTQHVRDPRICVVPTVAGSLRGADRCRHIHDGPIGTA
jgi:hypothetical protein